MSAKHQLLTYFNIITFRFIVKFFFVFTISGTKMTVTIYININQTGTWITPVPFFYLKIFISHHKFFTGENFLNFFIFTFFICYV